jgi:hypothetical protein
MLRADSYYAINIGRLYDMKRTTIYINTILLNTLKEAMADIDVQKDEMITLLVSRIIKKNSFNPEPYKTVKYQESGSEIVWKIEHINLEPEFYEKVLDLRRHFKFSVSWFIAFAITNYLDELVNELKNPKNCEKPMDNYTGDYAYISKMVGSKRVFITMLDTRREKT